MRCLILHRSQGSGKTATQRHAEWLEAVAREHAGYYGQPHGHRPAVRTVEGVILDAGYVPAEKAKTILLRLKLEEAGLYPADILNEDICGGWVTCKGNLTLVCGPWEYRDGRRHGVVPAAPCVDDKGLQCTWTYLETRCPGATPDECDLQPECLPAAPN